MGKFSQIFGKYLLLTNTVSCGLMMAAGDMMQQRSDLIKRHLNKRKRKNSTDLNEEEEDCVDSSVVRIEGKDSTKNGEDFDYVRTRNMTMVGLLQGPFHHYFYALLERRLPGRSTSCIFKKTVLDQTIASPTCLGIFFFGLGTLEQKNLRDINCEVKLKLFDTWKVDCMFWPPTQFINFLLVPIRYRVLYINFMTMIYDIFLSYMKYDAEIH